MSDIFQSEPKLRHIVRNRVGTTTGGTTVVPKSSGQRRKTPQVAPKKSLNVRSLFSSDDRIRHTAAILLMLFAVLLLLAIISYTPRDQANADIAPRDLLKLLSNDPTIAARAAATQNWLGLIGAFVATLLINGTFGYAMIVVPGLLGLWGATVYRDNRYEQTKRVTLFTMILTVLFAGICGTFQIIPWMFHPAHEWSGSVGAFIASVLSGLIGSAGSFLVLLASVTITLIYAVNLNISSMTSKVSSHAKMLWERLTFWIDQRLNSYRHTKEQRQIAANQEKESAQIVRTPEQMPTDNGPAQMLRDIKGREEKGGISTGVTPLRETLAPKNSSPQHNKVSDTAQPHPEVSQPLISPRITPDEPIQQVVIEPIVNKLREQPVAPPKQAQPTLTLDVTEAEHEEEVSDDGALTGNVRDEQILFTPPPVELLEHQVEQSDVDDEELKMNARLLQEKLATFNIQIENLTVTPGPVVTLYEFIPAAGIKISRIEALADDIALAIKARGIRIIAPIPGKGTVGIEIPNHKPAMVRIRSVLNTVKFRESNYNLPLALGKTTIGEVYCDDLSKMPHLLIAGATGAGKSVGVNAIIASLLYKIHPGELKFVIIDPKKIELTQYRQLAHHFLACSPDIDEQIITTPTNAVLVLKSLELEMERRYDILAKVGQRNIADYNSKVAEGRYKDSADFHHQKLPYIVVVIDELADLMITAAREVEEPIARLAQLARAVGLHLVVATQRPSVDVITGMIKANFPARIAYQVASKVDSRTILDTNGAEQLLGQGDMLYLPSGQPKPIRLQNAFISTEEVEAICEHIGAQQGYSTPYMLPSVAEKNKKSGATISDERDDLFEEAARLVIRHQQGSVSMLQRRMKVGYSRAARIMDELELAGIVGAFDGSKTRTVLLESEAELEAYL